MSAPRRVLPADVTPGWWWASRRHGGQDIVRVTDSGKIYSSTLAYDVDRSLFTAFYGPIPAPPAGWDKRGRKRKATP